jgi:hypothetical protein
MSAISDARTELHEVLKTITLATWRVHRTAPAQLTAPCVFIDDWSIVPSASLIAVVFPIVAVVDGAQHRQIEELDELGAAVWTAASKIGTPRSSTPVSLDVGGPSLRAHQMSVEIVMTASTLCPPVLTTSSRS